MARPDLPRTNSSGSGFFFCGIMLLPVDEASDNSKNPYSSPLKITMSSAKRLRCTMVNAHAWRKVDTKSRSDEASMLLATTRENPSVCARAAVSMA